jgi:hypothetical protein
MPTEFTRMRSPVDGTPAEIPSDAADVYAAKGWEPISGSRSYEQAAQELADAESAALAAAEAAQAALKPRAAKSKPQAPKTDAGQPGETAEKE